MFCYSFVAEDTRFAGYRPTTTPMLETSYPTLADNVERLLSILLDVTSPVANISLTLRRKISCNPLCVLASPSICCQLIPTVT